MTGAWEVGDMVMGEAVTVVGAEVTGACVVGEIVTGACDVGETVTGACDVGESVCPSSYEMKW